MWLSIKLIINIFGMYRELTNISLRNDECIKIIDHLTLNATSDRSSDHICELIQNLINNASFGIRKKVNINTNNSSEKQMPTNAWFDSECNKLRKNYKYLC